MRRNHMELIKHQRDATVHDGIRGTKHSLAGCIDCHVVPRADGAAGGGQRRRAVLPRLPRLRRGAGELFRLPRHGTHGPDQAGREPNLGSGRAAASGATGTGH